MDIKYELGGENAKQLAEDAKLILGITDTDSDSLIEFYVEDTISAILSYCRLELFPRQLEGFAAAIAAKRFSENSLGGVKIIREGERRVDYCEENYDFLSQYAERLRSFRSRAVFVPSDINGEKNE